MSKFLLNIGLVNSTGKLYFGEKLIRKISDNKIKLVLVAKDLGNSGRKNIEKLCFSRKVELISLMFNSKEISKSIGKNGVKIIGVSDYDFIKLLKSSL